ncbi:hypothetical protein BHE74_00047167 [Ensete ventricosum]|nr:hypothetical protein BHE74_00047167 [Ensete ventricosum]RZS20074.1 hypothetical protein BHM03_00052543 [Ensete ventricosum]
MDLGSRMKEKGPEVKDLGDKPHLKGFRSFGTNDMFFRADKIDLKSLDIELEKQINKAWSKENGGVKGPKEEWEIDLSKLEIRYVIAQGTYGIVYRGTYDGQDIAGTFLHKAMFTAVIAKALGRGEARAPRSISRRRSSKRCRLGTHLSASPKPEASASLEPRHRALRASTGLN